MPEILLVLCGLAIVAVPSSLVAVFLVIAVKKLADNQEAKTRKLLDRTHADVAPLGLRVRPRSPNWLPGVVITGQLRGVRVRLERGIVSQQQGQGSAITVWHPAESRQLLKIGLQTALTLAMQDLSDPSHLQTGSADLDHMYTFRPRQQPRLARLVVQRPEFHEAIRGLAALVPLSTDEVVSPVVRMWVRPDQSDLEWLERIVAPVAQRAAARVNAITEVGCLPGFTRSETTEPIAFSGTIDAVDVEVRHRSAHDDFHVQAHPPTPLPDGLHIQAADRPVVTSRGRRVAVRDPILGSALTVQTPTGHLSESLFAHAGVREELIAVLKEHPGAVFADGTVQVLVSSLTRAAVTRAATEAAALAALLGAAAKSR